MLSLKLTRKIWAHRNNRGNPKYRNKFLPSNNVICSVIAAGIIKEILEKERSPKP